MKPKLQAGYHFLIDLEKGKYPTPIHPAHPVPPKKGDKNTCEVHSPEAKFHQKSELNHKAIKKNLLFSKGLLTKIYFAKYLMSSYPGKKKHTHIHTHTIIRYTKRLKTECEGTKKVSNSDMAEILE